MQIFALRWLRHSHLVPPPVSPSALRADVRNRDAYAAESRPRSSNVHHPRGPIHLPVSPPRHSRLHGADQPSASLVYEPRSTRTTDAGTSGYAPALPQCFRQPVGQETQKVKQNSNKPNQFCKLFFPNASYFPILLHAITVI